MESSEAKWKFFGVASLIVGIFCYCRSSSFQSLYGKSKPLKITVWVVDLVLLLVCLIIICAMFYSEKLKSIWMRRLRRWHIAFVVWLILMVTSLYSFYYDKRVTGKPDIYIVIGNAAFAFMSLSLSKRIPVEFESGLTNYFLGCFNTQLLKISPWLIIPAAVLCYIVVFCRYPSESENRGAETDIESGGGGIDPEQLAEQQMRTDDAAEQSESGEYTMEETVPEGVRQRKKTKHPPEVTGFEPDQRGLSEGTAQQNESFARAPTTGECKAEQQELLALSNKPTADPPLSIELTTNPSWNPENNPPVSAIRGTRHSLNPKSEGEINIGSTIFNTGAFSGQVFDPTQRRHGKTD